jgi:ribose transport system substrate-binding protein
MKHGKWLALALVLAVAAQVFAGGEGEAAKGEKTFAIVYPIVHPFFEPVTKMATDYGKTKGVRILTFAPEGTLVNQQIQIMEDLISKKVNGIALCATDPVALVPYLNKAVDAGIPTIAFESDMPESKRQAFMGTHNYRAGVHLGHVLARELNYKGKSIICTGLPTQLSLNERIRGIKECLAANYPNVQIVDLQTGQGDPALTLNVIEAQIQAHPDFNVFTSIDATGGPVAVSIWRAKGWKGDKHKIVTFDDMPENLAGIKEGIVNAVITQTQWTWGPKIVDVLLSLGEGKAVINYDDTGTIEITAKNVDTYRQDKAWAYKFEK